MANRVEGLALNPVGVIRTPHRAQEGTPIQPYAARDVAGEIEIFPKFRAALKDLKGFERIWLIYWFDRAQLFSARVIPYRDVVERGLFATRAPCRPNPIGLSAVRLSSVNSRTGKLTVLDVDMLDGTPLLDIKPYVPQFDSYPDANAGWLEAARTRRDIANGRFSSGSIENKPIK
jgi:tRNA-Thr(GGU) m(6)t(6)A37 methyltransferase TsaA